MDLKLFIIKNKIEMKNSPMENNITKNDNLAVINFFKKNIIELGRGTAEGENQTKQTYLKYKRMYEVEKNLINTNIGHNYRYYIGNYLELSINKTNRICKTLISI
tara:strand:- start:207 stop:521 length:315 start_codon:yes stop_codon:yes gene_type:complete